MKYKVASQSGKAGWGSLYLCLSQECHQCPTERKCCILIGAPWSTFFLSPFVYPIRERASCSLSQADNGGILGLWATVWPVQTCITVLLEVLANSQGVEIFNTAEFFVSNLSDLKNGSGRNDKERR